MKAHDKFATLVVLVVMGSLLLSLSALATAESEAARAIRAAAATVPTNIPGIRTYAAPPAGFNPVTATEVELATYGFPARPDKQAHPNEYARWERAMKLAKTRWNGELRALPGGGLKVPSGSSPVPEAAQPEAGPKQIQTNNASGAVVTSGQKTFNKNSFREVTAYITVPTAEFPLDTKACSGQGYIAISSVGIDGFVFDTGHGYGFDPQLEAGVYEQVGCNGDLYYFAVVGWQGGYGPAFDVNPGDVVYAAADTSGGSNSGVYLLDLTSGVFAGYSVATSGIVGYTASWVVERMCCTGNQPVALANTTNVAFGVAFAETDNAKIYFPGSQASTTEVLAMTDDAGDQTIEHVTQGSTGYQGLSGLWFETENCAAVEGCTP